MLKWKWWENKVDEEENGSEGNWNIYGSLSMTSGSYRCVDEDASHVGYDDVTADKYLWTL